MAAGSAVTDQAMIAVCGGLALAASDQRGAMGTYHRWMEVVVLRVLQVSLRWHFPPGLGPTGCPMGV